MASRPPEDLSPYRRRRMHADVMLSVGGKAAFALLGAATTVVIARRLGPSGQGIFAVAFNLTLMLVQLGSAGMPVATPFFVARGEHSRGAIIANSLVLAGVIGVLLAALMAALKAVAPGALPGLDWKLLLITLAALPAALTVVFLQGVLLGQQRMAVYGALDAGQAALALGGVLLIFALGKTGIAEVLAVLTATRYVTVAAALVALRREALPVRAPDRALLRRMLFFGLRVYAVGLVAFVLIRLDLLLVNAILGHAQAGRYSLAGTIAEALTLLPSIIGVNMLPRLARIRGTEASVQVFRAGVVLFGAICALSVPAATVGIPIVFGHPYQPSVALYWWLVPGVFSLGMLSILSAHYSVRGYPRLLIGSWIAGLVLDVVLNLVLLEPLGTFVASLSSSVAYGLVLAAHLAYFSRDMGGWRELVPHAADVVRLLDVRGSRERSAFTPAVERG
jgi:O-antigen/teichoic acid export membrane protein